MKSDYMDNNLSEDVKSSDSYKMGEAIGNMAITKSNNNAITSMNVQMVNKTGLLDNNYSAIGID